jgi:hypothetical protein
MQSYDSTTGEPFASVYADDPEGEMHMGERLPRTIARTFGPDCKATAQRIVRAVNAHDDLVAALKALMRKRRIYAKDRAAFDAGPEMEAARAAVAKAEGRS